MSVFWDGGRRRAVVKHYATDQFLKAWENKGVRIIGFLSEEVREFLSLLPSTSACVKPAGIYLP